MRLSRIAIFLAVVAAAGAQPALNSTYESATPLSAQSPIDARVFDRLKRLDIQPANLSSDAVFLRRAFLDVIGTLPTAQEASQFLADPDPDKRAALIDRLLERDEFADYWAMKWSDLLRVKAEFPINLWPNAAQAYHHWIRAAIRENKPYDRFVRELLTASGSNFREAPVNFYRAMQSKSRRPSRRPWPSPSWARAPKTGRRSGWRAWRPSSPRSATRKPPSGKRRSSSSSPGPPAPLPFPPPSRMARPPVSLPDRDPREVFADWLIAPRNPWFARAIVNRVWCWLLGRGIIHEPDDIRPGQSAVESRTAGLPGTGTRRVALRPEAHLSADPELPDLSAFLHSAQPLVPRPRRISPTTRCAAWMPKC